MPLARRQAAEWTAQAAPLTRAETALIVAATFLYWNDSLRQIFPGVDNASVEFRLIHFAFYGLFCTGLITIGTRVLTRLRQVPLLLAVLALPLMSALWSIAPAETMQRSVAVIGSSLFGIYLACRVPPLEAFRLIGTAATLSAMLSIALIFFVPSVGLMSEGEYVNAWGGAHLHKNGLGQMTALGAIICLIVVMAEGMRRHWFLATGIILNVFLLAGSRSLTSQLVFVIGVVLLLTMRRFIRLLVDSAIITATLLVGALVFALVTISADSLAELLASFGKDATMSSRLPLWQMLSGFMEGHWWFGHGYEAFWTDESYAVRIIQRKLGFRPWYSHNGFLEVWLAFGLVGLALVTALIVALASRIIRGLYRDTADPVLLFGFVYVLMFLLQNAAEATILQRNTMSWALFGMLYVMAASPRRPDEPTRLPVRSQRARFHVAEEARQPERRVSVA